MHEDLSRTHEIKTSSNRFFGFTFAFVFLIVASFIWFKGGDSWRLWGAVAIVLGVVSVVVPRVLEPANRAWTRFGLVLHKIVNPVVTGVLFFLVLSPFALLLRLFGKTFLKLKFEPHEKSYWVKSEAYDTPDETMKNQF